MSRKNIYIRRFFYKIIAMMISVAVGVTLFVTYVQATEHQVVRVGFFKFEGYHEIDSSGHYSGYGYEFIKQIGRYTNLDFDYVGYDKSWAEMQQMLEDGDIDILTFVEKTPAREEKYDFSDEPIGTSASILSIKKGNNKYIAGDYTTYNGMKVGVLNNSTRNQSFQTFAEEKKFQYSLHEYNTDDELIMGLMSGEIDAAVTSNLRSIMDEVVLDEFDASEFYVAVRKGNTQLLSQLNAAIEQMDLDIQEWRTQLYRKYYTALRDGVITLSVDELDYLSQFQDDKNMLKVTVNPDRKPYSYFENGQAKGIIPELFQTVCERLNLPYEVVEAADRKEYLRLIKSGEIDLVMDGRVDYAEAEEAGYEMTIPYLAINISRLTRANDNKIERIAQLNNPDVDDRYLRELYGGEDSTSYDSMDECIEAVRKGKADATYLYSYTAQAVINEDYRDDFKVNILGDYGDEFGIAVRSDHDYKLLMLLNQGIKSLSEDYIQKIIVSNTGIDNHKITFIEFIYANPLSMITFFAVLVAVFSFMIFLLLLSKQKNVHAQKERKRQLMLERFIGYMCDTYEMLTEVNIRNMTYHKYSRKQEEMQKRCFYEKSLEGIGAAD